MKTIHTEIEIHASAESVWRLLTDFARFPQWNPFIRRISGEARAGARLEAFLQPPGVRGMTFHPVVLKAEQNRELRWIGKLWMPKLFDGEHSFILTPRGADSVHFVQQETFTGILVPLFARTLAATERGFDEMNRALKVLAEQIADGNESGSTTYRTVTP
jgi:hypothetical protein